MPPNWLDMLLNGWRATLECDNKFKAKIEQYKVEIFSGKTSAGTFEFNFELVGFNFLTLLLFGRKSESPYKTLANPEKGSVQGFKRLIINNLLAASLHS